MLKRKRQDADDDSKLSASAASKSFMTMKSRLAPATQRRVDALQDSTGGNLPPEIINMFADFSNPCGGLNFKQCLTRQVDADDGYDFDEENCDKYCNDNCVSNFTTFLNELASDTNEIQSMFLDAKVEAYVSFKGREWSEHRYAAGDSKWQSDHSIETVCSELSNGGLIPSSMLIRIDHPDYKTFVSALKRRFKDKYEFDLGERYGVHTSFLYLRAFS